MMMDMVEDRIRHIESRLQTSANLPEAQKAELLALLVELREELRGLNQQQIESAGGAVAHGESLGDAIGGLTGAVRDLEAVHPRMAEIANRLAVALANMGI